MPVDDEFEDGRTDAFGDDFARALRGAAALAPAPALHALTAGAERRGRRWRNRRRALVAGGLAVLILATGGFVVGAGGPDVAVPAAPAVPMTAEEVVELASGLLPPGTVVRVMHSETPGVLGGTGGIYQTRGTLLFDDGSGASMISYTVDRTELTPDAGAVCIDPFGTPQDSCERTKAPDGSVLVIDKLRGRDNPAQREWRATWAAPDGRRIMIIEHNGQPSASNRENPPLDAEQLRTLVTAPAWQRVFDALPARANPPKPPSPSAPPAADRTPSAAELLARLALLFPPGVTQTAVEGGEGANALVTFEDRTSLLSVHVGPPGARGLEDRSAVLSSPPTPLEVREQLADGTLVVVNRFGNGKSAVDPVLHWTAEVYYPDGRQVRLYEQNGENGYTARPGTPALSLDQLKAIVVDPAWRS
ncbi:hypothetical protein [Kitasatospora sp. NPDC050463]|uniref:hypothetical protein n=1 Tax=Kitasatospora sp. NPDC050463 TaxID=3155786 RepID=UPI00341091EF